MIRLQSRSDTTVEFYSLRDDYIANPTRPRIRIDPAELGPPADPIVKLTRECSALRLKLATAERRGRNSASRQGLQPPAPPPPSARTPPSTTSTLAHTLDTVLAQREAARTHVHAEMLKLAERYKALERTLRDMQDTLRMKDREIDALRAERDHLVAEREEARLKSRSTSRDRSSYVTTTDDRDRHHRTRDRSRSKRRSRRSDDLPPIPLVSSMTVEAEHFARARSMDVFLTKTDNWSGAQIIQAVDDLNAEINQFAAAVTDSCSFVRRSAGKAPLAMSSEQENTTPWLGPAFSRILALRDHTQDPVLVQLALQASIVTCCARSLTLFCIGFPSKLDALLSRVLTHMQSSEPQATSSRWRALTHRAIRTLYPGLEDYAISELVTTMQRWSNAVFSICGSSGASITTSAALQPQLRRIAEAVYKLARVTREEILSTTFEVFLIDAGQTFEPGRMLNKMREGEHDEDHGSVIADVGFSSNHHLGHGGAATPDVGHVLCTTELGLRCVTRRDARNSLYAENSAEADPFDNRTLLLPKVFLDSAMDVIERG
ncbi:uncharacterized protein BXZ73DRAFT_38418 [Epithele typhae]|uniref:uncharacterized protein n=1 Tax=Epithele typhae TaxID=378194 RepID=UPI002007FB34|nr:uncharacterized protein BXZ73DRAFT_38418 [Epithele typhae]KAH9945445.1 hypothetical protein BXZ73DRAFT_38418 [Epithele typhae]